MDSSTKEERFPVWDALSEFFLDTELNSEDHIRIAKVLSRSPYSLSKLEEILYYEVHPVCIGNLLCIAGEWAGFHPQFLMEKLLPRKDKRARWRRLPVARRMYLSDWEAVKQLIEKFRTVEKP